MMAWSEKRGVALEVYDTIETMATRASVNWKHQLGMTALEYLNWLGDLV